MHKLSMPWPCACSEDHDRKHSIGLVVSVVSIIIGLRSNGRTRSILPHFYVRLMIHYGPPIIMFYRRPLHRSLKWPLFPRAYILNELNNNTGWGRIFLPFSAWTAGSVQPPRGHPVSEETKSGHHR